MNNRIEEVTKPVNRRPFNQLVKPNEYASKIQKLIDHNYVKSQQIIKKFSSEIESEMGHDETPKQKSMVGASKPEWGLSQKFYKLGKTVMNNSFEIEER